ncbi:thioesterase family protein [Fusibacter bizertensis]|uniref:Thioesterase family protein n=1 Tax=Fusibacter bizertensis TaxID=1488331 RepID=A0ABT6NEI2_9FIRM|nr:thioesterase family protein [Fusibacter bizertensis]MDH8678833.1 thioesterase family protein [Fusibacter bizertensis]
MDAFANLYKGMTHTLQKKITIDDTALNYGSGKIENLFATPRLVALMVEACARLIDPKLPDGFVSVGNSISVDHFKPTLLGATVTVEVVVSGFNNGKYTFDMAAYDEFGKIGEGSHSRSLVHLDSFMNKANAREYDIAI